MITYGADYLYHYTSIDKLALILKNKTIRLNALCNMDDLQEGRTEDLRNIGRFFFVSCWTDDGNESIPMWNMYTTMEAGVRIGLPKNPFARHITRAEELCKAFGTPVSGDTWVDTFINLAEMIDKGVYSIQGWSGDILKKVIYTDDNDLLEPKAVSINGDKLNLSLGEIGLYKNSYWKFQKEWRYIMCFFPLKICGNPDQMSENFNQMANILARDQLESPFDYYDLDLRSDAIEKMIITPSPQMSAGNRVLLDCLLKQYNSNAVITDSKLLNLI